MEKLLNKLIEKGWKPYEYQTIERVKMVGTLGIMFITKDNEEFPGFNIRMLTSKESGLWQFVCENGMVDINYGNIREYYSEQENGGMYLRKLNGEDNYEYRLIESSLKNEDELEQFLLENIKVE